MKKILSILAIALLASCTAEKIEEPKDCNCNRVADYAPIIVLNGGIQGFVWTVNDCTGLSKQGKYSGSVPKIGECR
jgi:hypothetical protein